MQFLIPHILQKYTVIQYFRKILCWYRTGISAGKCFVLAFTIHLYPDPGVANLNQKNVHNYFQELFHKVDPDPGGPR